MGFDGMGFDGTGLTAHGGAMTEPLVLVFKFRLEAGPAVPAARMMTPARHTSSRRRPRRGERVRPADVYGARRCKQ